MQFRVLGPLEVIDQGRPVPVGPAKQRALLAVLLLHANEVLSSDRLIDELWRQPPATALNTLQVYIGRLRKALEPARQAGAPAEVLCTRAPGYLLHVKPDQLDAERFESLVAEARKAREGQDNEVAGERLRAALALWRGRPLADFLYEPFAQTEIARLEELRADTLENRFEVDLALGRHVQLVPELEAHAAEHPLRERPRAHLMLALYRSGRQAEALETYREARRTLVDELGIEPSGSLKGLEAAILNHDAALEQPSRWGFEEGWAPTVPAAAVRSAGESVRKTVTVLVVGAAGGASFDPEALADWGAGLRRQVSRAAELYGAEVTSVRGDEIIVVFGMPVVHEDDVRRAVAVAIDLTRTGELGLDYRPAGPGIGIGIATGEVLTGGTSPVSVVGDPVSEAQRLRDAAGAGEILLGEETHRLLGRHVTATALDSEPNSGWRLEGVSPDPPPLSPMATGPHVGRDAELRRLQQVFARATSDRTTQLVAVVGPPGIGKSRLVAEFTGGIKATVLAGRCVPYGEGITFRPLREIVDQLGDLRSLHELLSSEERGDLVVRRLAGLAGAAESVSGTEEIFWAAGALFEALARRAPLVLVFEDVHWAEPTFLDLIGYLQRALGKGSVLLLSVARPELLELRPDWGTTDSERLLLEPLCVTEAETLVEAIAPRLDITVRDRVLEAAEGNPLFIEQLLASLAEAGTEVTEVPVPPTIQAVLASRLDRLGPGERAVVSRAAVIGRDFEPNAAAALLPDDARPSAAHHLQTLIDKDLVEHPAGLADRELLRFRHALIQQAAYRAIPKRARAELHESFADWVERQHGAGGTGRDEILGYHLEQAFRYRSELGAVADSERAIGRRAAELLGTAGSVAFRRGDMPAAANLLGRACFLSRVAGEAAWELLPDLGYSLFEIGELERSEAVLAEAEEAAERGGAEKLRWAARAKRLHVQLYSNPLRQDLHELVHDGREIAASLREIEDDAGLARAWILLAEVYYTLGRVVDAEAAAASAAEHARRYGSSREEAWAQGHRAFCMIYGPARVTRGLRWIRALLAEGADKPVLEANMLPFLASLEAMDGDLIKAREHVGRGRALNRDLGLKWQGAIHAWVSGEIEMLAGDPAAAERHYRAARKVCEQMDDAWFLSLVAVSTPPALYAQGRYDEAWRELSAIDGAPSAAADVDWQIRRRGVHAKLLARAGESQQGETLAREAVALADASDFLALHGDALLDLSEVLYLAGRAEQAAKAADEAVRRYEKKENVVSTQRARRVVERIRLAT